MPILLPDELLAHATEEELDEYVTYLMAEAEGPGRESGEWRLQDRQQVAEDHLTDLEPGMFHELLYGGAVGGGKTDFMLWHLHEHALKYPNFHGLYLRRTFPQLRRSAIIRSLERFNRDRCRFVSTEYTWKFDNGSLIEFGYCETDLDVYNYLSAEYDVICWDELTQFPTDRPYLYLISRLRTSIEKRLRGLVPHMLAGTNPGGVGGAWVKSRFVDVAPPMQRVTTTDDRGNRSTRVFIPAKLADNRFIDADTYRAGLGHLDDDLRQALEDGSWDVIEGQYFTDWNRDLHVIAPFPIPPFWTHLRGIDYGYSNPFACECAAFDSDGVCYVYREHYATGLTPPQQARTILDGVRPGDGRTKMSIIDPSTYAKTGVGPPIAQQYANAGLPVLRGLNARVAGWARVREFLRPSIESIDETTGEVKTRPRLYIFDNCRELIRTLPQLVKDDKDPEDVDSDSEDHAPDALRYLLMSRPGRPRKPKGSATTVDERRVEWQRERLAQKQRKGVDHPVLGRL